MPYALLWLTESGQQVAQRICLPLHAETGACKRQPKILITVPALPRLLSSRETEGETECDRKCKGQADACERVRVEGVKEGEWPAGKGGKGCASVEEGGQSSLLLVARLGSCAKRQVVH